LRVADAFDLTGKFGIVVTDSKFELLIGASLVLGPLGNVGASGSLRIDSTGIVGRIELILGVNLGSSLGLTVSGDALSYDIYSQAAQAIRSVPAVMGGLPVQQLIAIGQSQSAGRLGIYLNAVHIRDPIYDGAALASGGQIIRNDLTIPVIKLLTESEFVMSSLNEIPVLQPDTDKIRIWPVAGSSHSEQYSLVVRAAVLFRLRRFADAADDYDRLLKLNPLRLITLRPARCTGIVPASTGARPAVR
jgi:hypothetical protein